MAMSASITGTPLWKVFAFLMLMFGVFMTAKQWWEGADTWFMISFLQDLWDFSTKFPEWVKSR